MLYTNTCSLMCLVIFLTLHALNSVFAEPVIKDVPVHPLTEFKSHSIIKPQIVHPHENRNLSSTKGNVEGGHLHDVTITYDVDGKQYILDLQINRDLISDSYFEKYQSDGKHVVNKPTKKNIELCHYHGKLRGIPKSWAAVSTCDGISGMIYDGKEVHYLERDSSKDDVNAHLLYRQSDIVSNHNYDQTETPIQTVGNEETKKRFKREAEFIHGPYDANMKSRYVELVLVVDNALYKEMDEDLQNVYQFCHKIVNIVNVLYKPLNIFIALVGVVVWTEADEITISSVGDVTLTNFLRYRRQKLVWEHPNDNAQLLTTQVFENGVVGKALKGPICTYEFSGAVSSVPIAVVGVVAASVTHEMGHNFGMEHDTPECECPSEKCIMSTSFLHNNKTATEWSSCSLEYLLLAFEHGMDYCLRNKPKSLFDGPICGNGFVEAGEQCDCGLKESCDNTCCNASTCMLYSNASCATGECCDLQTCQVKAAGTTCRYTELECDLPEYCTGLSEYCPVDVYKMDGEECKSGEAFCYQGSCRTHTLQCRLLWGPSGKNANEKCYTMNNKGSRHGNCGYNQHNQTYIKCQEEDKLCGMLHCRHLNERLEYGMEEVSILSHSFINANGSIHPCRTAIIDLGLSDVDPGLVPNGAKCGEGKVCMDQHCVDVSSLGQCPQNCSGNGICNNHGNCHCNSGFAPPLCNKPGAGGSVDSGPVPPPCNNHSLLSTQHCDSTLNEKIVGAAEHHNATDQNNISTTKITDNIKTILQNALKEFRTDIELATQKFLDRLEANVLAKFGND